MAQPSIRVLVVEDFEPFRRTVEEILKSQPEMRVICKLSGGLEAVRKAQELQPDLVLLDIGLPKLNGIEVARQICKLCSQSKVLFVSQENSADIVQAARSTGALGYVSKTDVGSDLLSAINTVLRGEEFVSSSLVNPDFSAPGGHTEHHPERKNVAPLRPQNVAIRHEVAFYADSAAFVDGFTRVAQAALQVGNPVILIATDSHRSDILQKLKADAVDVDGALENGNLIQLDALETVATLMVNDVPDPDRCAKIVGDLVTKASKSAKGDHPRIAICGECAPTLLAEGNAEAAIRLEHLWDEITRKYCADTLCGYLWSAFPRKQSVPVFERICAEHSAVVGRELGY